MIDRVAALHDGKVESPCPGTIGVSPQAGHAAKHLAGLGEKVIWSNHCPFHHVSGCGLRGFPDTTRHRPWLRSCTCKLVWWKSPSRIYVYDR